MLNRMAKIRVNTVLWLLLPCLAIPVFADGMIYRVDRAGGKTSYLVGTMHVEDPRVLALMQDLRPLLQRVDRLVIEMVPDGLAMMAVGAASLLPAGQSLSELLDAEEFAQLTCLARGRDLPVTVIERMKPWALAAVLSLPEGQGGQVLDIRIYLQALELGLDVQGLESAAEQVAVFDAMPLSLQLEMLREVIRNRHRMMEQMEQLTVAFLRGDLEHLQRLGDQQQEEMSAVLAQWSKQQLLQVRNERMLARLTDVLRDGGVMIAVGALHLTGDSGLIRGLSMAGFSVEPVR